MFDYKWVRSEMNLYRVSERSKYTVDIVNSGILDNDFLNYARNFFNAAEVVINYLQTDAANNYDIAKLDLWYFPMIYLYRHSLELLLKSCIFQKIKSTIDRKIIIGNIRHDLKQAFEIIIKTQSLELNSNGKWLMDYLSDISLLDRESDMFRYPFNKNLEVLFDKQTGISLADTHNNMKKAYSIISDLFASGHFNDIPYVSSCPKLIIEGGSYYQQSVVGYKYNERSFLPYFSSYRQVAEFLKEVSINHRNPQLFMPMCYMYRNSIELGLKRLIVEDSHIDKYDALKMIRKKKHSILGLWNSIESELRSFTDSPDSDITTLDNAAKYVSTFHNIDNTSDLFRYPCNKDLDSYFTKPQKFDIENVASCFEEFCNFIDGADSMLSVYRDFEADLAYDIVGYGEY